MGAARKREEIVGWVEGGLRFVRLNSLTGTGKCACLTGVSNCVIVALCWMVTCGPGRGGWIPGGDRFPGRRLGANPGSWAVSCWGKAPAPNTKSGWRTPRRWRAVYVYVGWSAFVRHSVASSGFVRLFMGGVGFGISRTKHERTSLPETLSAYLRLFARICGLPPFFGKCGWTNIRLLAPRCGSGCGVVRYNRIFHIKKARKTA
jgi:hypothetical protein